MLDNEKFDKSAAYVCTGEDKKSDAMMLMSPDSDWDKFLTPAPCAIAILGDLILISANTDFSLEEKPPKDGFKLLRYPGSFRASLVQVSNAGWSGFNEAHTSMDQIRLSKNIDKHVKIAGRLLLQDRNEEVEKKRSMALRDIHAIAGESLKLTIKDRFIGVMELTGDLLEDCTNTKEQYDEKKKGTHIAIKVAKTEIKSRQRKIEASERRLGNMEKEVKEDQRDFKAIDNMRSDFNFSTRYDQGGNKENESYSSTAVDSLRWIKVQRDRKEEETFILSPRRFGKSIESKLRKIANDNKSERNKDKFLYEMNVDEFDHLPDFPLVHDGMDQDLIYNQNEARVKEYRNSIKSYESRQTYIYSWLIETLHSHLKTGKTFDMASGKVFEYEQQCSRALKCNYKFDELPISRILEACPLIIIANPTTKEYKIENPTKRRHLQEEDIPFEDQKPNLLEGTKMEDNFNRNKQKKTLLCGMCIHHHEALYFCTTCELNICWRCYRFHKDVWIMMKHVTLRLLENMLA